MVRKSNVLRVLLVFLIVLLCVSLVFALVRPSGVNSSGGSGVVDVHCFGEVKNPSLSDDYKFESATCEVVNSGFCIGQFGIFSDKANVRVSVGGKSGFQKVKLPEFLTTGENTASFDITVNCVGLSRVGDASIQVLDGDGVVTDTKVVGVLK